MSCKLDGFGLNEDKFRVVVTPSYTIVMVRHGKTGHETSTQIHYVPSGQPEKKHGNVANKISVFGQVLGALLRIWFWLWPVK